MPTSTLSRFAQRAGKVYASASTWLRLIRERGWRRPRTRVHPAKPTSGIRATRSNEIWHIDVTVIRLLNGTKPYLHGVVDNFSRRLLAWKLEEKLSPTTTCEILAEAAKELPELQSPVTVLTDSGVENVNDTVDKFLFGGILKRVLAQVEIVESNSAIEVWWRRLKNFFRQHTGHRSGELQRYRELAQSVADLRLEELVPLDEAIPEFAKLGQKLGHRLGQTEKRVPEIEKMNVRNPKLLN
jgi:hypothetical protein